MKAVIIVGESLGWPQPTGFYCGSHLPGCCFSKRKSGQPGHQTGNNSGVLHCGVYYTPGSRGTFLFYVER